MTILLFAYSYGTLIVDNTAEAVDILRVNNIIHFSQVVQRLLKY